MRLKSVYQVKWVSPENKITVDFPRDFPSSAKKEMKNSAQCASEIVRNEYRASVFMLGILHEGAENKVDPL